jgi:hypothetical protein
MHGEKAIKKPADIFSSQLHSKATAQVEATSQSGQGSLRKLPEG